jgi:phospholipid/cholesterol/gamma-HCH transport system ATP-binding protein
MAVCGLTAAASGGGCLGRKRGNTSLGVPLPAGTLVMDTSSHVGHQTGPEVVVEVSHLAVSYGDQQVLKNISLTVHAGEILVIMGGSGSGKSTLLNTILGLIHPTAGEVHILGADVFKISGPELTALRKNIGVAFQGGALFSSLTVLENILLPLREHTKLDMKTMIIMARLKMQMVNLVGAEALRPAELSGGMVKRAALARAIIMDPKILFCDEPSAGIDPVVAAALDELILSLRQALGMSVVVVTHELDTAFKVADRLCIIDKGEVIAIGTVQEIKRNSDHRVQNMLHRRTDDEAKVPENYIDQLTARVAH